MFGRALTLAAGTTSARAASLLISIHYVTAQIPVKAVKALQPTTPSASLARRFSTVPRRAINGAILMYSGRHRQYEEERLQLEREREEERRQHKEVDLSCSGIGRC
jgi:hypothetical protein